jgi:lipoyl(octanoyl) transferase
LSYFVKYEDLGLRDYKETWDYQTLLFNELLSEKNSAPASAAKSPGILIFVEHPHVYTLGKSGSENNLLLDYIQLRAKDAKFYHIDRGGDITYHGPGQLVGYPVFDLAAVGIGLKEYIDRLEEAIIRTLGVYGLKGERLEGGTGVWLDPALSGRARKICAIGVRASRFVTMHGFAFNVSTDLSYFSHINPCGFTDKGVTSLGRELGRNIDLNEVKPVIKDKLKEVFGLEWVKR